MFYIYKCILIRFELRKNISLVFDYLKINDKKSPYF